MSTYKCVIWGTGRDYEEYFNAIKYQELLGTIEVIGVTSNQPLYETLDGYRFISQQQLRDYEFDVLIIASSRNFGEISREAVQLGIDSEKIVNVKVFALPEFQMDKYMRIKNSNLTIFSNNCWAAYTYNRLGLQFRSPFISMWESASDYLRFLKDPRRYLSIEPIFVRNKYVPEQKVEYPIGRIDDVELNFNHYASFDEAVHKWNSRVTRVNWDNLFVMMYTEDRNEASQFIDLSYANKVCFVPFETSEPSLLSITYSKNDEMHNASFANIVNGLAQGAYKYYDVLDLLQGDLNNKRVELRK